MLFLKNNFPEYLSVSYPGFNKILKFREAIDFVIVAQAL